MKITVCWRSAGSSQCHLKPPLLQLVPSLETSQTATAQTLSSHQHLLSFLLQNLNPGGTKLEENVMGRISMQLVGGEVSQYPPVPPVCLSQDSPGPGMGWGAPGLLLVTQLLCMKLFQTLLETFGAPWTSPCCILVPDGKKMKFRSSGINIIRESERESWWGVLLLSLMRGCLQG